MWDITHLRSDDCIDFGALSIYIQKCNNMFCLTFCITQSIDVYKYEWCSPNICLCYRPLRTHKGPVSQGHQCGRNHGLTAKKYMIGNANDWTPGYISTIKQCIFCWQCDHGALMRYKLINYKFMCCTLAGNWPMFWYRSDCYKRQHVHASGHGRQDVQDELETLVPPEVTWKHKHR